MGYTYGSTFKPQKLDPSRVGVLYPVAKPHSTGWITALRIITTIVELGLTFVPGIGTAAQIGIGLAGGAINEALDYASGSESVVGSVLNFGTPLIGGAFAGRGAIKAANALEQRIGTAEVNWFRAINGDSSQWGLAALKSGLAENAPSAFAKFDRGELAVFNAAKKFGNEAGLGTKFFKAETDAAKQALLKNTRGLRIGEAGTDTYEDSRRYFRALGYTEMEITQILNLIRAESQAGATLNLKKLMNLLRSISAVNKSRGVQEFTKAFEEGITRMGQLSKSIPEASVIYRAFQDATYKFPYKQLEEQASSWYKKLWRSIGTARFNDKYVQKAQLIDPNDLGRAPVEAAYKLIKRQIGKWFKNLDKIENLDKAFEQTGGVVLDSDVIQGYKVVLDEGPQILILISFRPEVTNNKRPVLLWSSRSQLHAFVTSSSPMRYYLDHWAVSRGGKSVGLTGLFGGISFSGQAMHLHSVLSFIPVPQLRNMLSIVSNYVENIHDMTTGTYQKTYFQKLTKSIRNAAISRSFRLLGNAIGGNIAARYFGHKVGQIVGKELQRVGTTVLAAGIKNVLAGKEFGNKLAGNALKGSLVSVRSHTMGHLRRNHRGTVITTTLSARRKLQEVKRIPNAVTPGRGFKGIKYK